MTPSAVSASTNTSKNSKAGSIRRKESSIYQMTLMHTNQSLHSMQQSSCEQMFVKEKLLSSFSPINYLTSSREAIDSTTYHHTILNYNECMHPCSVMSSSMRHSYESVAGRRR